MVEISRKSGSRSDRHSPVDTKSRVLKPYQQNISSRYPNERGKDTEHLYVKPGCSLSRYSKRLPVDFVAAKDWKLYIHFTNKVRLKGHVKPKHRVCRLLNSFMRLYQEYAYVCDNILPPQNREAGDHNQCFENDVRRDHNICGTFRNIDEDPNCYLKGWFARKLHVFRLIKPNHTNPYDKIQIYPQEMIEIYSHQKMQSLISHRISFTGFDVIGRPKIKWIQVPIALELLIPKVQSKIQRVMSSCNFLYDPLEVVAELRHFNYDVDISISHFHRTRKFRDILEGFLPEKSQLKELESHPDLWQKFTTFLERINSEPFKKTERRTLNDGSLVQLKIIEINCSIKKIQLSKVELLKSFSVWKLKYNKQILEYSKNIIRTIEGLKDFLMTDEQRGRVVHLLKQNNELKIKLRLEEKKRKTIYNMMQEQCGNVRVYCRCRAVDRSPTVLDFGANDTIRVQSSLSDEFKFDKVFEPFRTQSDIYEEVQPLVLSFIDGFNVCFIAYGGEASGKTYTLLGPMSQNKNTDKHSGITFRALREVILELSSRRRDWEFSLTGSIVEIYNDTFRDLLSENMELCLNDNGSLEGVQETLNTLSLRCERDIESLIKVCKNKRKIGETRSRSHVIIIVHLSGRSKIHGETISSFLGFCDLAGFGDIQSTEIQSNKVLSKEVECINRSLTSFNRMFTSSHCREMNSVLHLDNKLTSLLKHFLISYGKCILIVTVRTDKTSISSTQSTLRFGGESRGVALGKIKRKSNSEKIIF